MESMFKVEWNHPQEIVFENIKLCEENGHFQQVAYSTHGDTLTQICFTCDMVRTTRKVR